jgi:small subunit ribosomal protein S9
MSTEIKTEIKEIKKVAPKAAVKAVHKKEGSSDRYIGAVGRRKTASARVRITPASKNSITINGKELNEYFKTFDLQKKALQSLEKIADLTVEKFAVEVKVIGGGISSQSEAVRHGIARALITHLPASRGLMKKEGFLTLDARAKERRKFGLKKARKAPQWSKR